MAERGNLHVFKFEDINGNQVQDPGEYGVPAVRIKLRTPFGDEVAKLTDATGWAIWDKVAIGAYMITETVPIGWEAILPATTTTEVRIDATTTITFANRQIGNLHVFKFEDVNGNGLREHGREPRPGHHHHRAVAARRLVDQGHRRGRPGQLECHPGRQLPHHRDAARRLDRRAAGGRLRHRDPRLSYQSARVACTLQYAGIENVALLDGGINKWISGEKAPI